MLGKETMLSTGQAKQEKTEQKMGVTECTSIVLGKIQNIEPENATKIIGYLLLKHTQQEIMNYAFGTDQQIHSLIDEAKSYLSSSPKPIIPHPMPPDHNLQYLPSQTISRSFSSPSSFRVPAPYLSPHSSNDIVPSSYGDFARILETQAEFARLEEQLHAINPLGLDFSCNSFYPDGQLSRTSLRSPVGMLEFQNKACHYFYKGYCRHGSYCKYFHGQPTPDNLSPMYGLNPNELLNDDHDFSPRSLEQLDAEISEILKARNGNPVSIASLPSMYLEMYGKTLQAEGYLTESQRHGKAGFSLTKLLARLNSIRLIDRPHGQHAVVLAEDAPKYEYRNDSGAALSTSLQIYLTFPAESSFTDEDVLNYFNQFGPVHDVRIPRQEKRMFGFVSFHYPETVRTILAKGHPHHICGSRVLVKPYKEKTRIYDRKYMDRSEYPGYYPPQSDFEPEPQTMPRVYENSSLLKKQMMREQEYALELERMRLFGLQLTPKPMTSQSYFNFGMEDLNTTADHLSPLPVAQNNILTNDDKLQQAAKLFGDQDSGHVELPDSPFASRFENNIYTNVYRQKIQNTQDIEVSLPNN